ncbi:unnamed protein product, partial [marine sediment metagenome]
EHCLIENNSVSNNGDDGIYFQDDIYGNSTVLIENNSISNNHMGINFFADIENSAVEIVWNSW